MDAAPARSVTGLHGREAELETVGAVLQEVVGGGARSVLIVGDAGVGKTALARAATSELDDVVVAFGACLPLLSARVPYLGLRTALRNAPSDPPPPRLDGSWTLTDALGAFDEWAAAISRERVVVLVVDDVQWADAETLDVLTFLMAGPATRRLALVMTMRGELADTGEYLPRWLAGTRRLPRVTELELGPVSRETVELIVADVAGGRPHQSLVDEVFARGRGNPLLTRLIASGAPATRHLPADLPRDLRTAVLAAWTDLDDPTREAADALAVAGAPQSARTLAAVLAATEAELEARLRAPCESGLVERFADSMFWFRHPLHAEVLESSMTAGDRHRLHVAFAELYARDGASGDPTTARRIADHRARAGDEALAYRSALGASALLEGIGAWPDVVVLLRRAIELQPRVDPGSSPVAVLRRLCAAAAAIGAHDTELEAIDTLLELPEIAPDSEERVILRVRRMHLRFSTGQGFIDLDEAGSILADADRLPGTAGHAMAAAEFVHASLWHGRTDAAAAAEALGEATRSGDALAVSLASTACAIAANLQERRQAALVHAVQAVEAAFRARDWWACFHAVLWEGNAREFWTTVVFAKAMRDRRRRMRREGAPHPYLALIASAEAGGWLESGHVPEVAACLRDSFTSDPGAVADAAARLIAARLAARQGRVDEALQHVARVGELLDDPSSHLELPFASSNAEVLVAAGRSTDAVRAALDGLRDRGQVPTGCEWLMPLAARALANRIDGLGAHDEGADEARAGLRELRAAHPCIVRDLGFATPVVRRQWAALDELYVAELAHGLGEAGGADRWLRVAESLAAAELPWEAAHALSRAATTLVVRERDHRRGADVLRDALGRARALGAEPIVERLVSIARTARISLRDPMARAAGDGFTAREREILAYIVAGRTYAEIARALTISEKTVSTHVSHLLTKTGAANRVELADIATAASGEVGDADRS